MYLPPGTPLHERYRIDAVLGHGGFGITYLALDERLSVRVAIKEYLPRQMATRAEGQTRVSVFTGEPREHYLYGLKKFLEEAQAIARFGGHPSIVSCRDFFEANGTAYMVMPYLEGVTLKEFLEQKGGRIPYEIARDILLVVMDALKEVHRANLLHRDISPDNIFLTTARQVKLIDFGAARYQAGEQSKSLSVILKVGYAPEEQYRSSGKQGPWTDVYAVAATLYKCITGNTPPDALDRLDEDTLAPPSQLGVAIPPEAEVALLKALAVRAAERFRSIEEFQAALLGRPAAAVQPSPEAYMAGSVEPTVSVGAPLAAAEPQPVATNSMGRWPQVVAPVACVAILLILGGGAYNLFKGKSFPPPSPQVLVKGEEKATAKGADPAEIPPAPPPEVQAKQFLDQGRWLFRKNAFEQALTPLGRALELQPGLAEAHFLRGMSLTELKRPQEAMAAFQEAVRLKPDYAEARFRLGLAYNSLGSLEAAQKELRFLGNLNQDLADRLAYRINSRRPPTPPIPPKLDLTALKNARYYIGGPETVALKNGEFREGTIQNHNFSHVWLERAAIGDLNGDGQEDAAVIVSQNAGGSGTFSYLNAVLNQGGSPEPVATRELGDRVVINTLQIKAGKIYLDLVSHSPKDAMAQPTLRKVITYSLQGNNLVELAYHMPGGAPPPPKMPDQASIPGKDSRPQVPAGHDLEPKKPPLPLEPVTTLREKVSSWPWTSTRPVTEADLQSLSLQELRIMRNEIQARRGMVFSNPEIQRHFESQPWYKPRAGQQAKQDIINSLTPLERANADRIFKYEQAKGRGVNLR